MCVSNIMQEWIEYRVMRYPCPMSLSAKRCLPSSKTQDKWYYPGRVEHIASTGLQLFFDDGDRDYDLALGGLFGKSGVSRQVSLSFYELGV
mmetsp:Transcript_48895/g.71694  ORF Transcript_48895/g.71694 Transcript_48895/m.71694 type:complete len:91 (-) Transcript_48895:112-384(-)